MSLLSQIYIHYKIHIVCIGLKQSLIKKGLHKIIAIEHKLS